MSQLKKDFYIPNVHHVCRFCETPIAAVKEGSLRPLGNKAHVTILLESGIMHRFNCCASCADKVDFKQEGLLQQVWEDDCEMWKNMEVIHGGCQKAATARMELLKKEKAVEDFAAPEITVKDAEKALKKTHEKWVSLNKKG